MAISTNLAPLVGKKVKYKLGNFEHEGILAYKEALDIYFFVQGGTEIDARVCEIISND